MLCVKVTMIRYLTILLGLVLALAGTSLALAQEKQDYMLAEGDTIRIVVFQNPDLSLETRVTESGTISYPLIGTVQIGGLTIDAAERMIAKGLKEGGFVQQPQVNIVLLQNRGNQVSVLGQVTRPGRYPLETFNMRVSDMLAMAGGIAPTGADLVILTGLRQGKPFRNEIDFPSIFIDDKPSGDINVAPGDVLYVHRAPVYYIYGEAQRPGSYRIEREMTIQQALAQGGGATVRGTEKRLRLHRRGSGGKIEEMLPELSEKIQPDDVLYVRESLF